MDKKQEFEALPEIGTTEFIDILASMHFISYEEATKLLICELKKVRDKKKIKKIYEVAITETSCKNVFVKAESVQEAEEMVEDEWYKGNIILNDDDFMTVDFTTVGIQGV